MRKIAFFTRSFKEHKFGFTLVELIVVITILAILATIAFLSFQNYSSQARDTVRTSDLTNIQKGLELYIVKSRTYPAPNNPITYTGGANSTTIMSQGTIPGNMIGFSKTTPSDPLTNTAYTYSTSGDGRYYQIEAELENNLASNLTNTTYAVSPKLAVLKGNYSFDPSLPSLVISKESADKIKTNTLSGIFDPNVCFVLDGKSNLVDTSTGCTSKKSMSLKDFDSGLVGYWDMESTSGGLLSDLSGNGNTGTGFGLVVIGGTGGVIGKATLFNSGSKQIIKINDSENLRKFQNGISTTINFYTNNLQSGICLLMKYSSGTLNKITYCNYITDPNIGAIQSYINTTGIYFSTHNKYNYSLKYNTLTLIYDNLCLKTYLNGILINENDKYNYNIIESEGNTFIGGWSINNEGTSGNFFNGAIDDVKIYNRALSDQEVLQQAKLAGF